MEAHEAELARVGRHAGDEHAPRLEQRLEPRRSIELRAITPPRPARRPAPAGRRRRSAGSGRRSRWMGRPRRRPTAPTSTSAIASRSRAGSPRTSPSSACVARSSIISSASSRVIGHEPEGHVGRAPRRARRRCRASPSCRTARRGGARRSARGCRAASVRRAGAPRRPRAGRRRAAPRRRPRTASSSASAEAHEAALGLVGDARSAELERPPGGPASRAAATARRRVGHLPLGRGTPPRGRPGRASSRPPTGWAWARTVAARDQRSGGRDRGLLRPTVVVGPAPRGGRRGAPSAGCATTCTPRRTTRSTATTGASPTTPTSWPASSASPPRATSRLGFAISPGLSIDCDSAEDRAALAAKVDQVVAVGAPARRAGPRRHPVRRRAAGRGPRPAHHLAARAPRTAAPTCRSSRPSTSACGPPRTSTRWRQGCRPTCRSGGPAAPS